MLLNVGCFMHESLICTFMTTWKSIYCTNETWSTVFWHCGYYCIALCEPVNKNKCIQCLFYTCKLADNSPDSFWS